MKSKVKTIIDKLVKEKLISIIPGDYDFPARCGWDDRLMCFVIKVNKNIVNIEDAIMHELAHIIRGDIFINPEEYNTKLANLSMDLIINTILGTDRLIYSDGQVIEGITDKSFYSVFKDAPHWQMGWQTIYSYLMQKRQEELDKILTDSDFIPVLINSEDIQRKIKELTQITQVIKEIRTEILKELSKSDSTDLKVKIKVILSSTIAQTISNYKAGKGITGDNFAIAEPTSEPLLIRIIKKIIKNTINGKNVKMIKKTFRRESILADSGLNFARRMLLPASSILFIVDVSGSYINIAKDYVLPAIVFLKKYKLKPELITFDTNVYEIDLLHPKWVGGGGTEVLPIFKWLRSNRKLYNAIIFISDYEFFDFPNEPEAVKKQLQKFAKMVFVLDWRTILEERNENKK